MAKGKEEAIRENARSLKKNGVSVDIIAKSLNLTIDEINEL